MENRLGTAYLPEYKVSGGELPSAIATTVVGIGASAGALAALKTFFDRIPGDCGLAFVIIVHLSPDQKSYLADLLQPHVPFPVQQVTETTPLEPNRVYVIPPNANLSAIDTHLRLCGLENTHPRTPIDHFFRTLAGTYDGHAIGVILTGTGTDGTLGLKDIKARGGTVIVQDPADAEYPGMPQSAIATGLVDQILPIAEIPDAVLSFARILQSFVSHKGRASLEPAVLSRALDTLLTRTGADFRPYNTCTLLRRIGHRMQLNHISHFDTYLDCLRDDPDESQLLAKDLVLAATRFFRDPELFDELGKGAIPELFEGKTGQDRVRVWCVGCGTGEESYSLAMLLLEEARRRDSPPQIQIFASDVDTASLQHAQRGLYRPEIADDIGPERLGRFFSREADGFRIRRHVRDCIVFAPHNLLKDPPFSHLDLIFCRNLLADLNRETRRRVLQLFHYCLNDRRLLVAGSSESANAPDLFAAASPNLPLYYRRHVPTAVPRRPILEKTANTRVLLLGDHAALHAHIADEHAQPSVLISPENKIVRVSARAGRFLLYPGGPWRDDIFDLLPKELHNELRVALQQAREQNAVVLSRARAFPHDGTLGSLTLRVAPASSPEYDGFALIVFEEHDPAVVPNSVSDSALISSLENEIEKLQRRLTLANQDYQAARQELVASNEELQSLNQELRSTMRELRRASSALEASLSEKEELLKEVHHRVKNNLQVVLSIVNLQANQTADPVARESFAEIRNRIFSIANIHELLYRSTSLSEVSLLTYARQLTEYLVDFYGASGRVQTDVIGDPVVLPLERAVPCGLLLNELVSNVCKHAFPDQRAGELVIEIGRSSHEIVLSVADNGVGLPDGFDYRHASSLGLQLVHTLSRQLRGTVTVESGSNPGATFEIRIPAERASSTTNPGML
jgi:two-component system CheB/CheR fusion protein